MVLGVAGHSKFKAALAEDEVRLAKIVTTELYSPTDAQAVLKTLDNGLLMCDSSSKAYRLLEKLGKTCHKRPSSLIITGVTERDEYAGSVTSSRRCIWENRSH
jgi:hypothetical protein